MAKINYEKLLPNKKFRGLHSHLSDRLYSIVAEEVDTSYNFSLLAFDAKLIMENS